MTKTQDLAYVLHRRPYRETSSLITFFTQHHGVLTAVGRGVRQNKKKTTLEAFTPFWIEYTFRGSLASLCQYESELEISPPAILKSHSLYCALYLNELLIKLLGQHDPYPSLFTAYQHALSELRRIEATEISLETMEKTLRKFEFFLLKEIGYAIPWEKTFDADQSIQQDKQYHYHPRHGFSEAKICSNTFAGRHLLAMAREDFSDPTTLKTAKRLIRHTLDVLLENRGPLKSRELFKKI